MCYGKSSILSEYKDSESECNGKTEERSLSDFGTAERILSYTKIAKVSETTKLKNGVLPILALPSRVLSSIKIAKVSAETNRKDFVFLNLILPSRILSYQNTVI